MCPYKDSCKRYFFIMKFYQKNSSCDEHLPCHEFYESCSYYIQSEKTKALVPVAVSKRRSPITVLTDLFTVVRNALKLMRRQGHTKGE